MEREKGFHNAVNKSELTMGFGDDTFVEKKCSEWYSDIKTPFIREKALKNLTNDKKVHSIADAIDRGFTWSYTNEGNDFWAKLHEFYIHKNGFDVENDYIFKNFTDKLGRTLTVISVSRPKLLVNKTDVNVIQFYQGIPSGRKVILQRFNLFEFLEKIKKGELIEQKEENKGIV